MGFRYSARREALRLDLVGWVRNLPDGDVEVWAEGEDSALAAYRAWLERGPPGAWVETVSVEPRSPTGAYETFSVEF